MITQLLNKWNFFSGMNELGVLGINARIGKYILKHNKRSLYPLVDNKVLTQKRCEQFDIKTPENYCVLTSHGQIKEIVPNYLKWDNIVIKPSSGSQGNGILVIDKILKITDFQQEKNSTHKTENDKEREELRFQKVDGSLLELEHIEYHTSSILSGLYSLSGRPDSAIFQEKISRHPAFDPFSFGGIPDVRVIVYRGFPIMAMIRLPTKTSGGRANLHQGAVGCGLDMKTGKVTFAVCRNSLLTHHPDTGNQLNILQVPFWQEILNISARCYEVVGLGYLGVDIVLTPEKGPVLLEMNARPGLAIQSANLAGLRPRLEYIDQQIKDDRLKLEERLDFVAGITWGDALQKFHREF